jgi:hypothetical protein
VSNWVIGVVLGLLALFGLILASRAPGGASYIAGLVIFLVAIALIFALIVRATRNPPRREELGPAREP